MSLVLNEIRSLIRNKENDLQYLLDQRSDLENRITHNQEVTKGLMKLLERFDPDPEEDGKSKVAYRRPLNLGPNPFPDLPLDPGPRLR